MTGGPRPVRVAAVQCASPMFDLAAGLAKAEDLIAGAAAEGAELVVFPEAYLPGYPRGLDFGAVVGERSAAGREMFARLHGASVEIPGPEVDRLAAAAGRHGVTLVMGVIERAGGTLYCTALFLGPDGGLLGRHRKVQPTGSERLIWGLGDGSSLRPVDAPPGRLAAAICWENYMPLLRAALYAQGVQIWCAPTADARDTWLATMRHIAVEGRCFVVSVNQFCRRSDYPADYPAAGFPTDPDAVVCPGGSCVVDPFGTVLAGPDRTGEAVLVADLDLAQRTRGLFDLDVAGHYGRTDLFRLEVGPRPPPGLPPGLSPGLPPAVGG